MDQRDHAEMCATSSESLTPTWTRGQLLGAGSFGKVNLAVDNATGRLFAVKSVAGSPDGPSSRAALAALENEVAILSRMSPCTQVVSYLGNDSTSEPLPTRNLHLEYVPGGSLVSLLRLLGSCGLQERLLARYARDITLGLSHIHANGIVHGDIKGMNVLVAGKTRAKIADFGTAWRFSPSSVDLADNSGSVCETSTGAQDRTQGATGASFPPSPPSSKAPCSLKGTVFWMSPEVARQDPNVGPAADIWSLGCTLVEMATGRHPWHGHRVRHSLKHRRWLRASQSNKEKSEVAAGEMLAAKEGRAQQCEGGEQERWRETEAGRMAAMLLTIARSEDLPPVPSTLSTAARDFVHCCLQRNPDERWTAQQLLQHPFLQGLEAEEMSDGVTENNANIHECNAGDLDDLGEEVVKRMRVEKEGGNPLSPTTPLDLLRSPSAFSSPTCSDTCGSTISGCSVLGALRLSPSASGSTSRWAASALSSPSFSPRRPEPLRKLILKDSWQLGSKKRSRMTRQGEEWEEEQRRLLDVTPLDIPSLGIEQLDLWSSGAHAQEKALAALCFPGGRCLEDFAVSTSSLGNTATAAEAAAEDTLRCSATRESPLLKELGNMEVTWISVISSPKI